ncbi:unnamed protein product, partial [Symbiodinium microadriaticum]
LFSAAQQRKHEADIVALAKKRAQEAEDEAAGASGLATSLEDVLQGTKEFEAEEAPKKRRKKTRKVAAAKRKANKKQKGPPEASCGGKKLTVTMEKEDSDDEEFDVEITAPG